MEKVITQETKEVVRYCTSDGKEFDSEYQALRHELKLFGNQFITVVNYHNEEYVRYVYVDEKNYQTFIEWLKTFRSYDFVHYKYWAYSKGTQLFARVVEYNDDYPDDCVMYTYQALVDEKQGEIDNLTEALTELKQKFGEEKE